MSPAAILVGWGADRLLGDPRRWHPVAGFGRVAQHLETAMWRPSRRAGIAYCALLVGAVVSVTARGARAVAARGALRVGFEATVLWAALGGRSLERAAEAMWGALREDEIGHARVLAPALVGRDPTALDAGELARATVESVAENTSDAVVAPLLWGAVLGPVGVAAHRAINTLDAMVGHREERYARFGWASARLDDVANWPAARATALSVVAGAPLVRASPRGAWTAVRADASADPSPNAGVVEAAFAGALGLRLGGTNRYAHGIEHRPQLGAGGPATPRDIPRAIGLARVVSVAALAASTALAAAVRR